MPVQLLDLNFYRAIHADLASFSDEQAQAHFFAYGLDEGRRFSPLVDLNFYQATNPDLATAGLATPRQLFEHLQTFGIAEGRPPSLWLDLDFYLAANPDLDGSFAGDRVLAFQHLQQFGLSEQRRFSRFLDLNFYRDFHPDLSSVGLTGPQLLEHFVLFGINEGRRSAIAFDVSFYRSLHGDLVAAGLNNQQLYEHFAAFGLDEGRVSSPDFSVQVYLANNPDLLTLGFDFEAAYSHYVAFGQREGRPGSDYAGNTLATARSIAVSAAPSQVIDFVGATDPLDLYRFQVNPASAFSLRLDGLTADANVQLLQVVNDGLNETVQIIGSSMLGGTANEQLSFTSLAAGTYYIEVSAASGNTHYRLVTAATSEIPTAPGEIRGSTWHDVDGDRVRDAEEPALAGWTIYLDQNQNSQLDAGEVTTTTDANGNYRFANLNPGTYTVSEVVQPGWQATLPVAQAIALGEGQTAADVNFANRANFEQLDLNLSLQATGLTNPVYITHAEDGSDRLFIVEQGGRIRILQNGTLLATPFLDIASRISSGGERGLLGLAFPPDYANKGYFYVNYTDRAGDTVVARYRISSDSNVADANSEEILLQIDQPFANHNGGQLAFGPDGYLYIGTGDGGSAGDPLNNAQNPSSLLGKILRIDVESGAATYSIPATNPFLAAADPSDRVRDEIWALGLRNPWRFAFDRLTGDLFIGDVGQGAREEINFQPATSPGGENYGWRLFEGSLPFDTSTPVPNNLTLPVAEYSRSLGASVTGGTVYRGTEEPLLQGTYLYGDFISGRIWGMRRNSNGWENRVLETTPYNISTFGEDEAGNVYVADYSDGNVYLIGV